MKDFFLDIQAIIAYKIVLLGIRICPNGHFKSTMLVAYHRAIATEVEFLKKSRELDDTDKF
ncbi:MAG: hypothetical protein HQL69_05475 [Magnetococcales bacterium]|nr:hypothetical protein [Magnetococcales bacterium]